MDVGFGNMEVIGGLTGAGFMEEWREEGGA